MCGHYIQSCPQVTLISWRGVKIQELSNWSCPTHVRPQPFIMSCLFQRGHRPLSRQVSSMYGYGPLSRQVSSMYGHRPLSCDSFYMCGLGLYLAVPHSCTLRRTLSCHIFVCLFFYLCGHTSDSCHSSSRTSLSVRTGTACGMVSTIRHPLLKRTQC